MHKFLIHLLRIIFEFFLNLLHLRLKFTHAFHRTRARCRQRPKDDFNVVTVIDVLHHIKPSEQHKFIEGILNKIKPGVTLLIKDMSTKPWYCALMNIIHDLVFANQLIRYFPFDALIKIIENNGFEIQETNSKILLWYSHEWLVAKKMC